MRLNIVGAFIRNFPFGTEIAFKKGFDRLGGHDVTIIDPSCPDQKWDHGADATVVFKSVEGDQLDELRKCEGKKIVYQPDDLRFPHIQQMMRGMSQECDYAFTFDDDGAELALTYGFKGAMKLLLTADDELYHPIFGMKKDIDFSFIGSMTSGASHASRRRMVDVLSKNGMNVWVMSDFYDIPTIVNIYNRSKVVLNHATDVGQEFGTGYGYQCRHYEAGFTGACTLSNTVLNEEGLPGVMEFSGEGSLIRLARKLLDDKMLRDVAGTELYNALSARHKPEYRAQEMIDFIGWMS